MKLGTIPNGTRDGELVVVSADLTTAVSAKAVAPNLLHAMENWAAVEPGQGVELTACRERQHVHIVVRAPRERQQIQVGARRDPDRRAARHAAQVSGTAAVVYFPQLALVDERLQILCPGKGRPCFTNKTHGFVIRSTICLLTGLGADRETP